MTEASGSFHTLHFPRAYCGPRSRRWGPSSTTGHRLFGCWTIVCPALTFLTPEGAAFFDQFINVMNSLFFCINLFLKNNRVDSSRIWGAPFASVFGHSTPTGRRVGPRRLLRAFGVMDATGGFGWCIPPRFLQDWWANCWSAPSLFLKPKRVFFEPNHCAILPS